MSSLRLTLQCVAFRVLFYSLLFYAIYISVKVNLLMITMSIDLSYLYPLLSWSQELFQCLIGVMVLAFTSYYNVANDD